MMTKAEIINYVIEVSNITRKDAIELVEHVFETIKETLESGEQLKIAGFGVFNVKAKADRRGRNPQTGEEITIESRRVLTFKPSTILKERLNRS
jgi:integration host factor subunit alpha